MDLNNVDVELLLDKSGSMGTNRDCPGGRTRWDYGQEQALSLAAYAEQYDKDGITVVPFAGKFKVHEGVTSAKVAQVFQEHQPNGSTDTAQVLKNRLDAFFARKAAGNTKSCCIFVLTDGIPDDQAAVINVIQEASNKLDRDEELAIQFIQIGKDEAATKFLQFLDDNIEAKFDIVDTIRIADVEDFAFSELLEKAFAD